SVASGAEASGRSLDIVESLLPLELEELLDEELLLDEEPVFEESGSLVSALASTSVGSVVSVGSVASELVVPGEVLELLALDVPGLTPESGLAAPMASFSSSPAK